MLVPARGTACRQVKGGKRSDRAGGQEGGQPDEQGQDPLASLAGTNAVRPGHSLAVVSHPSSTDSMAVTRAICVSAQSRPAGLKDSPARPLAVHGPAPFSPSESSGHRLQVIN